MIIPVAIFAGLGDLLVQPEDFDKLKKTLPNIIKYTVDPNYGHMEYLWGLDAHTKYYPTVLELIRQYNFITKTRKSINFEKLQKDKEHEPEFIADIQPTKDNSVIPNTKDTESIIIPTITDKDKDIQMLQKENNELKAELEHLRSACKVLTKTVKKKC